MDPEGRSPPLILNTWMHMHPMDLSNEVRKGKCCGRLEPNSDGYYCCDYFVHRQCVTSPPEIQHPSHKVHTLKLKDDQSGNFCNLCGNSIVNLCYLCEKCDFYVDLSCVKYPPPEVIPISLMHHHKLTLLKEVIGFDCDAKCGKVGERFPYICQECNETFHVDCVWNPQEVRHPSEVNHPYHPLHPLKLHTGQPPDYSDCNCRLCGETIDGRLFYHCSACKFSLDMRCAMDPPPQSLLNSKAHVHQLTLLPRLDSFTCNACGLSGVRSPYMCIQCDFIIHQECLDLPRLININRHDHRVSRTSILGVVNSVCGVCRQKVNWNWGGFFCQRCPQYVVHSKCATRKDVWNGKELEGIPEEIEDIEPYERIDDNTIIHFSHKEYHLKFHVNGLLWEENKWCKACSHPIGLQSFYSCIHCDFFLHKNCAESRRKKWHVLHNDRLTLVTSGEWFYCKSCLRDSNGFMYECGRSMKLDVRCSAISEPFIHPSHSHHPLYYIPTDEKNICKVCKEKSSYMLTCIESGCGFFLCFHCATLPQAVKHRVHDHPLSLCYGEEASGKYWCDICEKETNPETWFYTCKDSQASLHINCILGDFSGFIPGGTVKIYRHTYEVVLNNSISRPFCRVCESHCMYPVTLKVLDMGYSDPYICSGVCLGRFS